MDCCGVCCGEDDREYWMRDRISPKIGLSDDDLLDFQSDEGEVSATPVVHHIRRSQLGRGTTGGGRTLARASHAHARKQPTASREHLENEAQNECVSTSPRQNYEKAPSRSLRSRHSLQATPAVVPNAETATPRTSAEGVSRAGAPPPTKLAALSAEEKEEEKKRLQALVKEFAREAVSGFDVRMVNSENGAQSDAQFTMDRFLTGIELKSLDEAAVPSVSLKMQDVKGIFKSDAAASRIPEAAKNADQKQLLLLEDRGGQSTVILAQNQPYRDKIYTCLKILSYSEGLHTRLQLQRAGDRIQILKSQRQQREGLDGPLNPKGQRL